MNRKLAQLAERRRLLVAQAAVQRTALTLNLAPWHARLALADKGIAAVRYIRRRPALMVGAALLLAALRRRRVGTWLRRGWLMWEIGRSLRRR